MLWFAKGKPRFAFRTAEVENRYMHRMMEHKPKRNSEAGSKFRGEEFFFSAVSCCTTKEEKRGTNSSHGRRPKGIAFWC